MGRRRSGWLAAAAVQLAGAAVTVTLARQRLRQAVADHEARARLDQLERNLSEERAHDARSAAAAIHGAAVAIAEASEELDSHARTRLARALASEARRLLHLMEPGHAEPVTVAPFALRPALEAVVACRRAPGFDVAFDVPDGLVALGHPDDTAEVLANLLDNARRHAAGSPVLVRAGTELGNVVVRVEDRGPGVDPSEFSAIFTRGRRGGAGSPDGQGLGLSVSRRLMRQQAGDLWVEGRPGGGASFVFYLPGFALAERTGVAPVTERNGADR
jgi:signal transduction histidine kinase